jgi:pyrimidine-specific ribonucleoside hydrolase
MLEVVFDMETQDPDDLFALCFLVSHPGVDLLAVTVTPGSRAQIGLIRHVLRELGRPGIPVGSYNYGHPKDCVSPWWTKFLGSHEPERPDAAGYIVLENSILSHLRHNSITGVLRDFAYITGGPLKNLGDYLREEDPVPIPRWVCQGGFAGDNVVPEAHRLSKFRGRQTCPTFNFNGDPNSAKLALASDVIQIRHLVSKNVCHGVVYDRAMHERVSAVKDANPAMNMIYRGMDRYLARRSEGKMFHDPLAACVAVDPSIVEMAEVEVYREKGEWGSKLASGTNTFISVSVDHEKFMRVFTTV